MRKFYKVCLACWHKEKYCKCENSELQNIDHNMAYILTQLNKKGYITEYSCGGHTEHSFIYVYVKFKSKHNFENIPEGFKYLNNQLFYKNIKIKNNKDKQAEINKKIQLLKEWVKLL